MDGNLASADVQRGDVARAKRWGRAVVRYAALVALIAASSALGGCAAEVATAPVPPRDYYYYPYTYYDGHIVYFVEGNWYYPYGNRWYVYRHVPPALASRHVYQYRGPYYRAPAARPYARPPYGHGSGPHHR
jgi:hypothetical protein